MENQKLRSKVGQLEIQIAEMKLQFKSGSFSGTYEQEVKNGGNNIEQNHGQDVRLRQSNLSSSLRISSTSMRSKPKLTKVVSSSGCQNSQKM